MPYCELVSSSQTGSGESDYRFQVKSDGCALGPGVFAVAKAPTKMVALEFLKSALCEVTDRYEVGEELIDGIEIETTHERILRLIAVIPRSQKFCVENTGDDEWKFCLENAVNERTKLETVVRACSPQQAYMILRSELASYAEATGLSAIRIRVDAERIRLLIILEHEQLTEALETHEGRYHTPAQDQPGGLAEDWYYPDSEKDFTAADQMRKHFGNILILKKLLSSPILRPAEALSPIPAPESSPRVTEIVVSTSADARQVPDAHKSENTSKTVAATPTLPRPAHSSPGMSNTSRVPTRYSPALNVGCFGRFITRLWTLISGH